MKRSTLSIGVLAGAFACAAPTLGGSEWVTFNDETSTRLIAAPSLGAEDALEKDFAWGDLDNDGDVDLINVRKGVGSSNTPLRNVLYMNEGMAEGHAFDGVLVDRTEEYATASTHPDSDGFLDATNDRDVIVTDVNDDGWLDIVTAPAAAYGPGSQPDYISHPRIYINLGEERGEWLGLSYEHERVPTLSVIPNFCAVSAGDIDGNGMVDLYFSDYFNNLEDRLLVNTGSGTFVDQTGLRMHSSFVNSNFGTHSEIADLNGDGRNDIVRTTSLGPYDLKVAYNNGPTEGFFTATSQVQTVYTGNAYFVSVADLNNDGLLDLVETDDGSDRYFINQGNNANGQVNWFQGTFPNSGGFGVQSYAADLDNDGWQDVLIADVDVDLPSCGPFQRLKIFHNQGNAPNVTFVEDTGSIPESDLTCSFHTAVFDVNGDEWLDIVVGRWTQGSQPGGIQVWINQPPAQECPADLNGSGDVNAADLALLLGAWNTSNPDADLNGSGSVNAADLALLLGAWGDCP